MQWWQPPFLQVALPVMVTFILATWYQSGRISDLGGRISDVRDSLGKRIDDFRSEMNIHFAAVEKRLDKLDAKVDALQERSWR
jgi:hypothetical protein